ncbi:hypothetical protein BC940DRAFT_252768 [Gongronella butleri]|nr:hypothetical protein BC940DRAFT_252768 [Gongronella butleri]
MIHAPVPQPPSSLSERLAYVDALVDMCAMVIEAIWPASRPSTTVVPVRCFIQEVLKRSKTSWNTLQAAFFYLFRARQAITAQLDIPRTNQIPLAGKDAYIHCGRRMFLASLVVASKYVQDKTYRNAAWARMAGLPVHEINTAERVYLELLDYKLYIDQTTFDQWLQLLHLHLQAKTAQKPQPPAAHAPVAASAVLLSPPSSPSQQPVPELSPPSASSLAPSPILSTPLSSSPCTIGKRQRDPYFEKHPNKRLKFNLI